jgi:hypothetical protein
MPGWTTTTTNGPIGHRQRGPLRAVPAGRDHAGAGRDPTARRQCRPPSGDHPAGELDGSISFATARYKAGGRWLAGQSVEVVCDGGLIQIYHRGVLVATHARRHPVEKQTAGLARGRTLRPSRPTATAASVTRKVDNSGCVCFAGTSYRTGNKYRRRQVQVAVVGDTVEISIGNELIKSHKIRHDRTREHGALANPGGRPHRSNAA